jgi:hypothetical protein
MRLDPFRDLPIYDEAPPRPAATTSWYRRLFAIHEIEASAPLRWLGGALLVTFLITFHDWSREADITAEAAQAGTHQCWPHFQSCGDWYLLSALPDGYSQMTLYAVLFGVMLLAALAMWRDRWATAHRLLVVLFVWKVLGVFVLTTRYVANFHYFHLIFCFLFLFAHGKLYFLRRTFVVLYVLAGTIKINEGWVLGTYFTSLVTGLPLVPDALVPLATNAVILLEVVVAPCMLLTSRPRLARAAFACLVAFHLYSGILVGYRYPTMVLGPLLCLFGPRFTPAGPPFGARSLVGWSFLSVLLSAQLVAYVIPGDVRYTLEGNYFGVFMFEANHQCRSRTRIHDADGVAGEWRATDRVDAHNRCDPYAKWFRIQQQCKDPRVGAIEWTFDHSVNGSPFLRMVDEPDACQLDYRAFAHNPWIRLPGEAAISGYPAENVY